MTQRNTERHIWPTRAIAKPAAVTQKMLWEWTLQRMWRTRFIIDRRGNAHSEVAKAIKSGRLPPAHQCKCADCGKAAVCYDHRDYTKPLAVDPVCKSCDGQRGPGAPYISEHSEEYKALLPAFKRKFWNKLRREARQRKKMERKWAAYRERRKARSARRTALPPLHQQRRV